MTFYNRFYNFICKPSDRDGRIIIAFALAAYFLSLFIVSLFTGYTKAWEFFGVPGMDWFFGDLKFVTTAIRCKQAGYDVYKENPCNEMLFCYPKIWFYFSFLGMFAENNTLLGVVLVCLYYLSVFFILGKITVNEGIIYSCLLCSPPFMLAVERGQPDLIIFILCSLAVLFYRRASLKTGVFPLPPLSKRGTIRSFLEMPRKKFPVYWAMILILFAGMLKLYPFGAILSFINENKKKSFKMLLISMSIAVFYIFLNLEQIKYAASVLDKTYWSVSVGLIHGSSTFLNLLSHYSFFNKIFQQIPVSIFSNTLVLTLFLIIFIIAKKRKLKNFNEEHIFAFRLGVGLYASSFIIGSNYDYKFIVFLFAIPQMLAWIKHHPKIRKLTMVSLLSILITCWSFLLFSKIFYWVIYTAIEESLNWFIFGYFVFMFMNTLPHWAKEMFSLK